MITRTAQELEAHVRRSPDVCPVCTVVAQSVAEFIDSVFYERVTDPPTRETIRKAGGFCPAHTRAVERQADALGTSLIVADILRNQVRSMDDGQWDRPPNTMGAVARILDGSLPGRAPCPICREERGREEVVIDRLCEALRSPEFGAIWETSHGLCIPHFRLAFLRCRDTLAWRRILDVQRRSLETLAGELDALARKFDYRSAPEVSEADGNLWKRGLKVTSGWPDGRPS